ncbi:hypothetical protein [Aquabacterium sp.]|uniref:hypothetical protein n=1 Tax=Aquabacterium sp. TaxID=1872578 RepID=UPI0025BB7FE7|nr:hypothetical protein [Aquabacterium sp.]
MNMSITSPLWNEAERLARHDLKVRAALTFFAQEPCAGNNDVCIVYAVLQALQAAGQGWQLVPSAPPDALLPLLTSYDSVEGMSERDQHTILSRLRSRWSAILQALALTPATGERA